MRFREAVRFWFKLGWISFGGPAGQIAIMHRELVERRKWLSEERFLHALNYCMLLPGPEAQQLATYVGWLLHKVRGGLVAGVLFVLPSVFILLGLSWLYVAHGESPAVAGLLYGFRPVVVAIVVEAVLRIGRRALKARSHFLIAAGAFIGIYVLGIAFPAIVAGAALIGWAGARFAPSWFAVETAEATDIHGDAGEATTDSQSPDAPRVGSMLRRSLKVLAIGLGLWTLGYLVVWWLRGSDTVHLHEYTFFTQAALVTFGGAYAVLAYIAQAAVSEHGWLSEGQVVDGLALAETTPGPLVMVVQFVGFVAAWNHPEGLTPGMAALIGALVTGYVTFLPCFVFIFLGAPLIESLRANRSLASALSGVTAAVVGVVLNLALVFGAAVLLPGGLEAPPSWTALAMAVVAFVALWRLKVDVLWVVVAGGLLGLARALWLG